VSHRGVVDGWASRDAACQAGGLGSIPVPARPTFSVEKWLFYVTLRPGARCKHCNGTVSDKPRRLLRHQRAQAHNSTLYRRQHSFIKRNRTIALYRKIQKIAVASSLWRLEVGLSVQTRVISQTRCPGSDFKVKTVESKGVPHLEAWEYRIQRTA
jgi:hypothetical protein